MFACETGITYPITIDIINNGTLPYLPSAGGSVTLSTQYLTDYTFDLTQAIQPGEVFSMVVNDWFLPTESGNYFVYIELSISDDAPFNNYGYADFNLSDYGASDISLSAYLEKPACFSTELIATMDIYNESCSPIPAGSLLNFSIENLSGTVLWTKEYVLDQALAAFDFKQLNFPVTIASSPQEELMCKLVFTDDPDLMNNEFLLFTPTNESINADYLNKFSNETELNTLLSAATNFSSSLVTYLGKSYVGSIGYDNTTPYVPCPNFEDNFDNGGIYGAVNTTLNACVDFSPFQNSVVSFDLIQFRNSTAVANGNLYTSMLRVKWDGNESGKQIIYGQPAGQIVHYELNLPHYFKGGLKIDFYAETGNGSLAPSYFPTDDVVLLDNLRLKTNSVGISDQLAENGILVSPNPTHDNLDIKSAEPLKTLELVGLDGKLLKREMVEGNTAKLDLTGLKNGLFFLRLQGISGIWVTRKVVKMGN
jgi:hypothetical protein